MGKHDTLLAALQDYHIRARHRKHWPLHGSTEAGKIHFASCKSCKRDLNTGFIVYNKLYWADYNNIHLYGTCIFWKYTEEGLLHHILARKYICEEAETCILMWLNRMTPKLTWRINISGLWKHADTVPSFPMEESLNFLIF